MLPYSPLHHLLFQGSLGVLVMTSGNVSDEPIAYRDDEARERLSRIADYFLLHNREIHIRCDDSVARVFEGRPIILRRSRGYVPFPIKLAASIEPILACGAELKNTFCLTRGPYAFVSDRIGDLENLETLSSFEQGIEHFKRLFSIEPKGVAHDLHPDYLSTHYALALGNLPKVAIQHHHAHIVSCTAENGVLGRVIGVALDGTGLGTDGTLWGGEFLIADPTEFRRAAHLKKVPMLGGSEAIKEPWRMAAVYLDEAFGEGWEKEGTAGLGGIDPAKLKILRRMIDRRLNTPLTSSMGRLFDAVSALLSIRPEVHYEGQAAIELEAVAAPQGNEPYPFALERETEPMVIDPVETIRAVVSDLGQGTSTAVISRRFHETIATMMVETCDTIRRKENLNRVALSGGVFQNMLLLGLVSEGLRRSGFEVYTHHIVPPNDGGISLGQALICHTRLFECV